MKGNLHQANIEDVKIISETFDLYRIFYKQNSDLSGANQYIENRLKNN